MSVENEKKKNDIKKAKRALELLDISNGKKYYDLRLEILYELLTNELGIFESNENFNNSSKFL